MPRPISNQKLCNNANISNRWRFDGCQCTVRFRHWNNQGRPLPKNIAHKDATEPNKGKPAHSNQIHNTLIRPLGL